MTYGEAIREALYQELKNDSSVIMFGEDIRHNLYGYTGGLYHEFGDRVIDVPLMENTIVGMAIGASLCGLRPIVDLTVANFLYTAMDQIVNIASKLRSMNDYDVPITIMCAEMDGMGPQHSDRPHELFRMISGLKVVTPSTPQEAYSMLRDSIQDNDPIIYFSDRSKFFNKETVIL
jgi:acetoin:2,6-dichlorophenolindophenol oxidoreductase subunit beta